MSKWWIGILKKIPICTSKIQYITQVREFAECRPTLLDSAQNLAYIWYWMYGCQGVPSYSLSLFCSVKMPKISSPHPKIDCKQTRNRCFAPNAILSWRTESNSTLQSQKSDIFKEKVSLWGYFHRPWFFKKWPSGQCIFEVPKGNAPQR